MVATTFANVAMDLVEGGVTGRMVAIQDREVRAYDCSPIRRSDRER